MPLFGTRKVRASADEIADAFLVEFVGNEALCPTLDLRLTEEQTEAYRAKCRLYRLASVLVAFLGEEQRTPKVLEVRHSLEQQVLGSRDQQSEALLQHLREAMLDLRSLLFPDAEPRELSWARSWLAGVGMDAYNPVRLTLFASTWMSQYTDAVKSLREFRIT